MNAVELEALIRGAWRGDKAAQQKLYDFMCDTDPQIPILKAAAEI